MPESGNQGQKLMMQSAYQPPQMMIQSKQDHDEYQIP